VVGLHGHASRWHGHVPMLAVHTLNRWCGLPHLHQDIAGIGVRRAETVAVGDSVPIARAEKLLTTRSAESVSYSWVSRSARVIWSWSGSHTKQISVALPIIGHRKTGMTSFQLDSSGVTKSKSSRDSSNASPT
jgi:hypothetical protein